MSVNEFDDYDDDLFENESDDDDAHQYGQSNGTGAISPPSTTSGGGSLPYFDYGDDDDPVYETGDYDDFEYDNTLGSLNSDYLASIRFNQNNTDDAMHLFDNDDDGRPDRYETSWRDINGIEHREHGEIEIHTNGTATLTGLGIGGSTLHRETVDLSYDADGQLTGLVSTTGIDTHRIGMIDYSDDDDPISHDGEYDDFDYDDLQSSSNPNYLASIQFDLDDADDAMHLFDSDDDGAPDQYETRWRDASGIEHREHGQIAINSDGTATLTGLGIGGTALHTETVNLSLDADGQLTGLASTTGIAATRMGMFDFSDDDDPLSIDEGYEYEDLHFDHDHAQTASTNGYLSSIEIINGDRTHLYDTDEDGTPDHFKSYWRVGEQEHVEEGDLLFGANNAVSLIGRDENGTERFREDAEISLDADGQMVGLTMSTTGGTRATTRIKTWDDDLLEGVEFDDDHISDINGESAFHRMVAATDFSLAPTASTTLNESAASAIDLNDAVSILKMIVGLDQVSSGYQVAAADLDESGEVDLNDAIGVLKHVVGLTAPAPSWSFVTAGSSVADTETLEVHHTFDPTITQDVSVDSHVDLVGILRGDVDGSWEGV